MVVKRYFFIQKLCFTLCGIDTQAKTPEEIVKRPLLCYGPLAFAIAHIITILHYAWTYRHDYVEISDSLSYFFQLILAIWKMLIFLGKRKKFLDLIQEIHDINFGAVNSELSLIRSENIKDVNFCTTYFVSVSISGTFAFCSPIIEAIIIYFSTGDVVLRVPYKASYFWNHSHVSGYSLVYIWNILSVFHLFGITLAIDTLFTWLVSNISAQFQIVCHRFNETAKIEENKIATSNAINDESQEVKIKKCIEYHNQILERAEKLNRVYGEIIFIKFIISCSEICCLVFRLSRPNESVAGPVYIVMFLITVGMQLILYCYNGERIRGESFQVAPEIYLAFDWSQLVKSYKTLLLLPMMRSQNTSRLKGVFFVLDLSLFLWVFKTAGSLIAALRTLDEKE